MRERPPAAVQTFSGDTTPVNDQTPLGGVQTETEPEQAPTGEVGEVKASNERIGVGSGDESVARIQLAARWAEAYAPASGDSLENVLKRFHRAYAYIDSVTHSVDPDLP